jgi:S-DNA-T family DNA segregation ATPase FtsK/SpoIIIE
MKNKKKKNSKIVLPEKVKRYFWGTVFLSLFFIFFLGIFGKAGIIGKIFLSLSFKLIGKATYFLPIVFLLTALVFFFSPYEKFHFGLSLAIFLSIFFLSGIFGVLKPEEKGGGFFGFLLSFLTKVFGPVLTQIIFWIIFLFSIFIFWSLLKLPQKEKAEEKPSLIKRIFFPPKFEVKKVETAPIIKEEKIEEKKPEKVQAPTFKIPKDYKVPPLDLLESEKGQALPGDIVQNSLIIKKTLEHFGIPVEMGEVNVGPTVTQYTLKPAEGIKLSRITSLSNDLALALASHPIRIEAPIPGKSLVGIEVPNKVRLMVKLRELLSHEKFQTSPFPLTFPLGRDVAGVPVFANLAKMPHLLVAGATGTGKTIFLNDLILSLIFRNSPMTLRFILVDPKRVEFPVYNDLPHLLTSVIFDPKKVVLALRWLVGEMERRFDLLSEVKARNISSYNETVQKTKTQEPLPYIVLIIDELADLMAARGKEIEAGIVRIAQMARAVGIHLVVATQRPSVEVLTGLIKANITSRIAFQVASQFDSRTILDTAGAEKLLGSGDLLFLSAENPKPKRIQAPYVSEKEVKKVVDFICKENEKLKTERVEISENSLAEDLEITLSEEGEFFGEDPLYEEAKRLVIEAQKASASLLQRRLRIGYARAARLLDLLEERGIVGPAEGAKPRKVLIPPPEEGEWKQI